MGWFKKNTLMLCLVLVTSVASAHARVWTYEAPRVPKKKALCVEDAVALGEMFKAKTGLEIHSTTAEEQGKNCRLLVNYFGGPLSLVTTIENKTSAPAYHAPREWSYGSIAECEKDLPAQVALFKAETGIEPFNAYCQVNEIYQVENDYYGLKIDAFGEPARRPRALVAPAMRDERQKDVDAAVEKAIESLGATIFHKSYDAENGTVFHFYSENKVASEFKSLKVKGYHEQAQCEQELADGKSVIEAMGAELIYAGCSARLPARPSELTIAYAKGKNYKGYVQKRALYEVTYPDFEGCLKDKARLQQQFSQTYGWKIVGSFCGTDVNSTVSPTIYFR